MIGFGKYTKKAEPVTITSLTDELLVLINPQEDGFFDAVINFTSTNSHINAFIEAISEVKAAKLEPFYKPIYDPSEGSTQIFGQKFVNKNSYRCKIKIGYRIIELVSNLNMEYENEIKLCGINKIEDMSYMFYNCKSLKSLPDFDKIDTSKITNIEYLFFGCESLESLPDLSKWNTSRVTNMSSLFCDCKSLLSLPDISKWNISKVKNLSEMFKNCFSLSKIPNIGKWDISSVENISYLFWGCRSLYKVPDISNWDTRRIQKVKGIFGECISLSCLPDISKWDIIPYDIFYFNTINLENDGEIIIDMMIKKGNMSKEEVNKIYDDFEDDYLISAIIPKNDMLFHIVKYKGDRDKLRNYFEDNI